MTIEARLKKMEAVATPETKTHIVWVDYKALDTGTPTDEEYSQALIRYEESHNVKIKPTDKVNFVGWGRKNDNTSQN